jgi:hypothetical protein
MKNKSAINSVLVAVLLLLFLFSCKKEDSKVIPTVTIGSATNISETSATFVGEVTSDGGATVTARGVCWSNQEIPTTAGNKTTDGSGVGSFSRTFIGLTYGVTYYVRAYAINEVGTAYSSQVTFNALALLPVLTTTSLSDITAKSVISGGNITNDGGSEIANRGVCWATTSSPTINDSKTIDGNGTGSFTSEITELEPLTTYYFRAYATNSAGTAYGNQLTTTTLENLPTIPAYKTTSQYATNGNRIEEVKYEWDINTQDWVNFSKIIYSYDSQGHKTESISSNWNETSKTWINNEKYTFSYFAFGKMWSGITSQWNSTTEEWEEYYKYDDYSSNDSYHYLLMTLYYGSNYNWEEYQKYKLELTIDSEERITQQIRFAESYGGGYYDKLGKTKFIYDSKGNVIDSQYSAWDNTYGWSDVGYYVEFTYDANENPTEKLTYTWDSNSSKYIVSSKIIYTYDASGNQIEYIVYTI